MKVAYVLSRYPTVTETFIRVELQTLLEDGVELHVYPLRGAQDTAWVVQDLDDGGVSTRVRRFGHPLSLANLGAMLAEFLRAPGPFLSAASQLLRIAPSGALGTAKALFMLPKACRIARHARAWGVDHVHAHFANLPGAAAAFVARLSGASTSHTSHAFDLYCRDEASLARLTEAVDFVATISERNRAHYAQSVPEESLRKVELVHCGVDLEQFDARGTGHGALVSVGRLVPKKGFPLLIRAVALLADRGVDARCMIIGEGEQRAELEALIAELAVADRVELTGARPPDAIHAALARASAFVLPCVQAPDGDVDGIPVSLMEAMAMEKVVVTSRISGITELVTDRVDGILVESGDLEGLADVLVDVIEGNVDSAALGRRARERIATEFDCRANARRLFAMMSAARERNREVRA